MNHDHASHMAYLCSGAPWSGGGGSWIGHVLPGVFLVAWGLHWFVAVTQQGLTGVRKQPVGAAHHTPVFLPAKLQVSISKHLQRDAGGSSQMSASSRLSVSAAA